MARMKSDESGHYLALYDSCIVEAAAGGRFLMEKMLSDTRLAMTQPAHRAASSLEREAIAVSLEELTRLAPTLCSLYPAALMEAFAGMSKDESARPSQGVALSFDQLELMDEAQVQESVEQARAQQTALLAAEGPLAEFQTLICAAAGLKTVQADGNPLRPEIYVRTLRAVLLQSGASTVGRLRWMPHMGASLGQGLAVIYTGLSGKLRKGGVVAAGYVVTQMAATGGPRQTPVMSRASSDVAAASQEQVLLTVRQLRRLLAGEFDTAVNQRSAATGTRPSGTAHSEFNMTVPAAFEVLQELKQVEQVMKRLTSRQDAPAGISLPATLAGDVRRQLRAHAQSVGQRLGLEVVNLMVENINADARLLPPLRQAVSDMEPALMRLALIDPRFFSDRHHPARKLLEQMTQRGLAWKDADAPGFVAFMDPLVQVVHALAAVKIEGAEPFAFALKSLLELWGEQHRKERSVQGAAVQSLLRAEQRNLLALEIAHEIRAREDAMSATPQMMVFLTGPWAQVMAQARLGDTGGSADPGGYGGVINDLLWSAQPALARHSVPRLMRLVPALLATLREGLARIDYPPEKTAAFFDGLMAMHQQGMRPAGEGVAGTSRAGTARAGNEAADATALAADLAQSLRASPAELEALLDPELTEPWIAPDEAAQSGFMPTGMLEDSRASTQPPFEATGPAFASTRQDAPAAWQPSRSTEPGELLPVGAWVEFLVGDRATRSQLSWSSPHGSLYMFTNAEGATHSMTRGSVQRLLAEGGLKIVSEHTLVEEALNAVARAAMENSLDISL
jgi:hypothetical protein